MTAERTPRQTLRNAADALLSHAARRGLSLSQCLVLVPNDEAGVQLRSALFELSASAISPSAISPSAISPSAISPQIKTFPALAQQARVDCSVLPDGRRMLLLYQALRERDWFAEVQLWPLVFRLGALFDELTTSALNLPRDIIEFSAQLAQAYGMHESDATGFEARVVHALWFALSQPEMGVSPVAEYGMRLAQRVLQADNPLFLFGLWQVGVQEQSFLQRWAQKYPVLVLDDGGETDSLNASLQVAWEDNPSLALRDRAQQLKQQFPDSPWSGRVRILACQGLEQEAQEAARQIQHWQHQGSERIAVLVQDRLTARRLRALLERQQMIPYDETGWSLDTTTAAAFLMHWLEAVETGFPWQRTLELLQWRALLPLDDAPFFEEAMEHFLLFQQRRGATDGLAPWFAAVLQDRTGAAMVEVTQCMQRAVGLLAGQQRHLQAWLDALEASLLELGVLGYWQQDAAGMQLFAALAEHRQAGEAAVMLDLTTFRRWLDHWLQSNYFVAANTNSALVFTHLAAIRGRAFDAVFILGGDAAQWAPRQSGGPFFNQAVRAALGLPGLADIQQQIQRDLTGLLTTGVTCCVSWQVQREGENNPLASWFERLDMLHELAWGNRLRETSSCDSLAGLGEQEIIPVPPSPGLPAAELPTRISVSAYNSLLACPYQYYVRSVLKISATEPVQDDMVKSDYGRLVHDILYRFHTVHPRITGLPDGEAERALRRISEQCYAESMTQDSFSRAWLMRWQDKIPDYLHWQLHHEEQGWVWHAGEHDAHIELMLDNERQVRLYGRIDRIDTCPDGSMVLDYKTGNLQTLKQAVAEVDEDVQLPAYAAMLGKSVTEAAFVSLDGDSVADVRVTDGLQQAADCSIERLRHIFDALQTGVGLPANGATPTCAWCEAQGICRRGEWTML